MDDNTEINTENDVLWLTDNVGKSYLVHRSVIAEYEVPEEEADDVKNFLTSDVQGYGNAKFLLDGVISHMGTKAGMKEYDVTFDLDNDGDIDWGDYGIAKKHFYEQYGTPTTNASPSYTIKP